MLNEKRKHIELTLKTLSCENDKGRNRILRVLGEKKITTRRRKARLHVMRRTRMG